MKTKPITHATDHGTLTIEFDAHGLTVTVDGFAETVIVDAFDGRASLLLSAADDETIAFHPLTKDEP